MHTTHLVFDTTNGYEVLSSVDQVQWYNVTAQRAFNKFEMERYIENRVKENDTVEHIKDFYCRIPQKYVTPETKVF